MHPLKALVKADNETKWADRAFYATVHNGSAGGASQTKDARVKLHRVTKAGNKKKY